MIKSEFVSSRLRREEFRANRNDCGFHSLDMIAQARGVYEVAADFSELKLGGGETAKSGSKISSWIDRASESRL